MTKKNRCPDHDALVALAENRLDESERNLLITHNIECQECAGLTERLLADATPPVEDPAWGAVAQRLDERFHSFLASRQYDRSGQSRRAKPTTGREHTRIPFRWAFAFACSVILAFTAGMAVHSRLTPEDIVSARAASMDVTRSSQEAVPAAHSVSGSLVISFFIPVRVGARYEAAVVGPSNEVLMGPSTIYSYDELGHFTLVCKETRGALRGARLLVKETGVAGGAEYDWPL